jgi:cell division protein FtsW
MLNFDLNPEKLKFDKPYLITTCILMVLGLIILYSASPYMAEARYNNPYMFIFGQLKNILIGLIAAAFIYFFIDYRELKKFSFFFIFVFILLLIFTKIYGDLNSGYRSSRWLPLGFFNMQTSEFAKLALIIYIASFYDRHEDKLEDFQSGFLPPMLIMFITIFLIFIEPDFSTGAVIGLIAAVTMFIGGAKLRHLSIFGILFIIVSVIVIIRSPYKIERLTSMFNPAKDLSGSGYQLHQSLISLGNGGIFGQGLGNGVQKELFLPDCHTDFIFSVVGEEMGFVFSTLILGGYLYLFWRGIKIAMRAPDKFGKLLAISLNVSIFTYVLINVGVVCGILPVTGLPLPFMSYGGSAMLYNLMAIGLVLNISKYSEQQKDYRRDYIINA